MSTHGTRITKLEVRRRQREISAVYPYVAAPLPDRMEPARYFITDQNVVNLAENYLMEEMPAALFFSGTYRKAPGHKNAAQIALDDFDSCVRNAGYGGRFFSVAHANHDEGHIHVHAICDWSPRVGLIGQAWGSAHGIWKAGLADPGGYYYVAKRACDQSEGTCVMERQATYQSEALARA